MEHLLAIAARILWEMLAAIPELLFNEVAVRLSKANRAQSANVANRPKLISSPVNPQVTRWTL